MIDANLRIAALILAISSVLIGLNTVMTAYILRIQADEIKQMRKRIELLEKATPQTR